MRILNQLRFIGSNVLSETADGISDFRAGVVPEVRVEANRFLDLAESKVDEVLEKIETTVRDLRNELLEQAN